MGQLLKIVGGLAFLYQAFGGRAINAISDRVLYRFDKIRLNKIMLEFREHELIGILPMHLIIKQSLGVNISADQLFLNLSQQGVHLGRVVVQQAVVLPNDKQVIIPFNVIVPPSNFLDRLSQLLNNSSQASWLSPIDIRGTVYLSNGIEIPISDSIKFIS